MLNIKQIEKVFGSVETLTPEACAELLKLNTHNRPIRQQTVIKYANSMKAGDWKLNGEPIIISSRGDVIDGQHRLLAAMEAGVPLTTLVVRNIEMSAFDTVDTGINRTGGDILSIDGIQP